MCNANGLSLILNTISILGVLLLPSLGTIIVPSDSIKPAKYITQM